MAVESITGLSTMENDIKMLSSEKQIIENESDNLFKMSVADMEKEREGLSNELKDTIEKCNITSSELEKAMLSKKEVQTLLEENQKLKNDNLTLLAEHDDLKARLQNLDMEYSKLRETITDTKAENESLIKEKHLVQGVKSELETKLEEKTQQISNLQETIKDLEAAKIDMHTEVIVHQEQKTTALAQLHQVEASLKNLENQLNQQREKNSDMTNDIARLDKQLVDVRRGLHGKIVALHQEKDATLLELQKSQAFVSNFENMIEQQNKEFSSLQQANDELQKTIYTLTKESEQGKAKLQEDVARLDKQLVELRRSLHAKITTLHEDKDVTLLQLQESQAYVRNFESVIEVQNEKISYLHQNNDELKKIICTLTEESEQDKAKLQEDLKDMTNKNIVWLEKQLVEMRRTLHAKIAALHQEKDATLMELHASQVSVMNYESVVEQQNEKNLSLQKDKNELQKTIYTLTHELDQSKAKMQEKVSRLDKQLVEVWRSFHAKIVALHEEKDVTLLELQKSQASIRNFDSVVGQQNQKISSLQRENDDLQKTIYTMSEDLEQAKVKFQEELARSNKQLVDIRKSFQAKIAALHQEKDASLLELQKYQVSVRNFECVVEKKNENISSLQQANVELEKTICTLTQELDQAKATLEEEISMFEKQMVEVRRSLHTKIAALHEGKDAALLELHASQAFVRNLENLKEQQNEEFLSLQQANDELLKTIYTLTKESEQAKGKLQEEVARLDKQLVELRKSLHGKIAALHEDKDVTLLQLQESQACIRNFESVIEVQNKKTSYLQQNNDELQKIICTLTEESEQDKAKFKEDLTDMTNKNIAWLENQLVEMRRTFHAKIAVLKQEKDATLLELHASQASMKNSESVVEQQNEKISCLQQDKDELQNTIYTLTLELDQAKAKFHEQVSWLNKQLVEVRRSFHAKSVASHDENNITLLELQKSQASMRNFESVVGQQNEKISSLQRENDELKKTIHNLSQDSEQAKSKFQEELARSNKQLVGVRRSLQAKITALHQEKDASLLELQKYEASVRNFECVVENKNENISSLQQGNDELEKRISTLTQDSDQAKATLQEEISMFEKHLVEVRRSLHAKIAALHEGNDATLLELHESQASVRNFENVIEQQNEKFSSLQQANDELKKTIYTLTKESEQGKAKLQEDVARLDKQLVEMRRSLHAKIAALHEDKDATLLQLQESQASSRNFKSVIEVQNEKILYLQQNNDELQKIIWTSTEESQQGKAKLQEDLNDMTNKNIAWLENQLVEMRRTFHAKIAVLHQEKDATLLELHASQASVKNSESVVEQQNEKNSCLQQDKDELQKIIYTLTLELDRAKAKFQEEVSQLDKQLVELRRSFHAKSLASHEENNITLLELQKYQASMTNFESVVGQQNEKISSLQRENDELKKTIHTLSQDSEQAKSKFQEELARSNKQLVGVRRSLQTKIVALHQEKDTSLLELQKYEASVRNFECVVENKNENISSLRQGNDELEKRISTLTQDSDQAKATLQEEISMFEKHLVEVRRSLHAKIAALHEGNDATLLELHESQASVRNFENVIEQQNEKSSSLQQANDELKKTIYSLTKELEQGKAKLQEEVARLDKQLVEMRRSLHDKIVALHEDKDATLLQLQESQASSRNFESVIEVQNEKISYLQQNNDELQKIIWTSTEESEQGKAKLHEDLNDMTNKKFAWLENQLVEMRRTFHAKIAVLHQENDATLLELHASQASVKNSESVVEQQNEKISCLQQDKDELQKIIYTLTLELDQAKAKFQEEVSQLDKQLVELRSFHAKSLASHEENNITLLELQKSQASMNNFESVVGQQNEKISSLQRENDELKKTIHTLSQDSEQAKSKFQEELARSNKQLVGVRRSLQAKIAALHQEKDASLLELQKYEASLRNFECVVENKNENISSLRQGNDELEKRISTLTQDLDQAKATLQEEISLFEKQLIEVRKSLHAKMAALHEDKDVSLLELQATRAFIRKLESVVEEQNENISSLQEANDELQKTLCSVIEESERAKVKHSDEVKTTQEEKDIVVTRLKQSESYIKNLENEVARLIKEISVQLENNSKLDKHLEEATLKVSKLHEKLEESQAEMVSHIDDMNLKTKELEDTIDALSSQKTKVEEDLKILVEACSGNMSKMKEFEDTVKQRTTNDVTRFRPIHQSLKVVLSRYQKLQCAYDELSARTSRFEVLEQNQMEQADKIRRLKEEKLNTFMENTKLHKYVQDLEIQLQHVKQKLMENKWKEDRFAATLETSQAEIQNLEQLVSLLEETLQEIKEHAESGVFSVVEQLDKLESSFSQGFPRFVYRSSASNEELKVLRNKLHGHLDEQKELFKKKDGLGIRLRNKEKVLSKMVRNDAEERILEKKVEEKESGEERTNNTSKRWPILRRRKWRRNSYSC